MLQFYVKGAYARWQFSQSAVQTVNRWAMENKALARRQLTKRLERKICELLFYVEQPLRERWYRIMPVRTAPEQ
jgi:hypothetical protein